MFLACSIQAQDIFKKHGFDKETLTLSKGRYEEVFTNKEIVQIGSVLLNTKTNKVVKFLDEEAEDVSFKAEYSSRWLSPDPLAEKYPWISPYAFCMNNPVRYIDPNGREVVISGTLSDDALKQLQARMNDRITLTMNENGKLSYTVNEGQKLKGDAKRMAGMIDNSSITVNLITTDKTQTSTGNLFTGGAFMGNTVTTDANGNEKVVANQEINPNVLGSADAHTNTMGKMIMHETTEAYAGAQISQKSGVSSPRAGETGSIYQEAHNRATPQTPVYESIYDAKGNQLQMLPGGVYPSNVARAEWYVTKNGKSKIIQTFP
ncbi:MAG: hypothetical protein FWD60_13545 [Candidatus Azobacteroides sp.]|nr:hypothetical protein [Candidatus Azobacteroides sp.]